MLPRARVSPRSCTCALRSFTAGIASTMSAVLGHGDDCKRNWRDIGREGTVRRLVGQVGGRGGGGTTARPFDMPVYEWSTDETGCRQQCTSAESVQQLAAAYGRLAARINVKIRHASSTAADPSWTFTVAAVMWTPAITSAPLAFEILVTGPCGAP